MKKENYDAVVVGSGFGGSVTAYRYQTGGKDVCLLERGKRYRPGDFPRSPSGLSNNVWSPDSGRHGMFEVWMFDHIEAVVSSAFGGGSIIYANVLLEKPETTFDGWPLTHADLASHYKSVRAMIGTDKYPFQHPPYDATPKTRAFADAATGLPATHELPPLAVTFRSRTGATPVPGEPIVGEPGRYTCRLCGECNVGCNFGSKNTLDFNYLRRFEDAGGDVETLAEVTTFEQRTGGGFCVEYVSHNPKTPGTHHVTADRLVLAAGSLGSSYLLLRKAKTLVHPPNPDVLGSQWCGNGDLLASLKNAKKRSFDPEYGPVITSALKYDGGGYYIEDGGYPAFIEWLTDGMNSPALALRTARVIGRMLNDRIAGRRVSRISRDVSVLIGDGNASSRTLPLCGMGDDVPDGRLSLSNSKKDWLENSWSETSSKKYFTKIEKSMKELAKVLDAELGSDMILKMNKLITAHPVGGCPMGTKRDSGVVDQYGRVFGVPGLSIADGSILPGPVGSNPSLTIAAIADRAATYTLGDWQGCP